MQPRGKERIVGHVVLEKAMNSCVLLLFIYSFFIGLGGVCVCTCVCPLLNDLLSEI